jgi:hypothetical protein
MKNQFTSRDYKLLSAYLDDELGIQERTHLESRLKDDPELRKELQELDKTRSLLRSLPRIRAPRNYFINAEVSLKPMGVRPKLRLVPAYGIVSAIATILLVLVVFGDRLLSTSAPASLAPAPEALNESMAVQQEVERSVASTSPPTEAAPMVMSEAPALGSPLPPTAALKIGESEIATPTTIYLNALPPSSTPEVLMSILSDQTITSTSSCEGYAVSGTYPTLTYDCLTPTGSPSNYLQGTLVTATPTYSLTETPISTNTTTPTATPTPSPSPSPAPTDTLSLIPTTAPGLELEAQPPTTPSEQVLDAANPTPTESEPAKIPGTTPNFDFLQYLVLAFELSLAAIAIIAGIIAIILRIRAGR